MKKVMLTLCIVGLMVGTAQGLIGVPWAEDFSNLDEWALAPECTANASATIVSGSVKIAVTDPAAGGGYKNWATLVNTSYDLGYPAEGEVRDLTIEGLMAPASSDAEGTFGVARDANDEEPGHPGSPLVPLGFGTHINTWGSAGNDVEVYRMYNGDYGTGNEYDAFDGTDLRVRFTGLASNMVKAEWFYRILPAGSFIQFDNGGSPAEETFPNTQWPDRLLGLAVNWRGQESRSYFFIDGVSYTPEPATLILLAVGGLALLRRRRAQ